MKIRKDGWHNGNTEVEDVEATYLKVNSVECCGWFEVSNFGLAPRVVKGCMRDLENLTNGNIIFELEDYDYSQFPLYCVLISEQREIYHDKLIERGFKELESWENPNTRNVCTPYHYVPGELSVETKPVTKVTTTSTF